MSKLYKLFFVIRVTRVEGHLGLLPNSVSVFEHYLPQYPILDCKDEHLTKFPPELCVFTNILPQVTKFTCTYKS
jgi:hypothetical protein